MFDKIQRGIKSRLNKQATKDTLQEDELKIEEEIIDNAPLPDTVSSLISGLVEDINTEKFEHALDSYNEAKDKDREVYISMFGSDEEKEQLKKEKEEQALKKEKEDKRIADYEFKVEKAIKLDFENKHNQSIKEELAAGYHENLSRDKIIKQQEYLISEKIRIKSTEELDLLKEQQLLKVSIESEIIKMAYDLSHERDKLIYKLKTSLLFSKGNLLKLEGYLSELNKVPLIYWEVIKDEGVNKTHLIRIEKVEKIINQINTIHTDVETKIEASCLKELKSLDIEPERKNLRLLYVRGKNVSEKTLVVGNKALNRLYDIKTTALIDRNLNRVLDFMFDYINTNLVCMDRKVEIPMTYVASGNVKKQYTLCIDYDNKGYKGPYLSISFIFELIGKDNKLKPKTYTVEFKEENYYKVKIENNFEQFFVDTFTKQWLDTDNEKEKIKGVKSVFISSLSEFNVDKVLEDLEF